MEKTLHDISRQWNIRKQNIINHFLPELLKPKNMKKVQVIESVENNSTEWVISLTDNNPEAKDSFAVSNAKEAFRIKEILEAWANK